PGAPPGPARAPRADRLRAPGGQRASGSTQYAPAHCGVPCRRRLGAAEAGEGHGGRGQDRDPERAHPAARGARRSARNSRGDRRFGRDPAARGSAGARRGRAKIIDRQGLAGQSSERQPAQRVAGDPDRVRLHSAARENESVMPRRLVAANVVLAALAAVLVLYIARQFMAPMPLPVGGRRGATSGTAGAGIDAPRPPVSAYNVVAARNLFSPTRTEAPSGAVVTGAPLVKPNLFGVVVRESGSIAYLEDPTTKRVAGYRVGDRILGGTVQTIRADVVTIDVPGAGGAIDVRLHDPRKPRATPPPLTGTPPPTLAPARPAAPPPPPPPGGAPPAPRAPRSGPPARRPGPPSCGRDPRTTADRDDASGASGTTTASTEPAAPFATGYGRCSATVSSTASSRA